jgi:uncharacterized membrane protein YhaH (DUF805 family)
MDFNEIIENFLDVVKNKYVQFTGRAGRKEYWLFYLVNFALYLLFVILTSIFGNGVLTLIISVIYTLFGLAILLPGIAVCVRRLHDVGKGGGWAFIAFVPIVGVFILLYFMIIKGEPNPNRFGPPVE